MCPSIDIDSLGLDSLTVYDFGDTPELSAELIDLILEGEKTATCATVLEYEKEDEPMPKVGEHKLVVDYHQKPVCIIEVTEVPIVPFGEVDADFAYAEGEGDKSLQYWRAGHTAYFNRVLPAYGAEFTETIPLLCQKFRVIKTL